MKRCLKVVDALRPEILPWIDTQGLRKATPEIPQLFASIFAPDASAERNEGEEPPFVEQRLADHPEVKSAYDGFRPRWEEWSAEYRRRQAIQTVYAELFRIHTQIRKQGEILELVLGLGLLDWNGASQGKPVRVRRHTVTAQVDLRFDPASGSIHLGPAADGARLRIEDDMLEPELRPDRSQYTSINEQLDEIGDDVWDKARMHTALRSWATSLHPDSQWSSDLTAKSDDRRRPHVSFAPALILRPRSHAGMVRIYETLIQRLSSGGEQVPPGWRGLVEDEDDTDTESSWASEDRRGDQPPGSSQEIYFPLPANREQRRIVESLGQRRGVLVQGPPGTGKSHTIANLVCHLLATGKKVLITAETGRALRVLKEKLPDEIQPLCVSLLGQDGDAFAELNSAIQGITTRQAGYSEVANGERIAEIDRDLDAARRLLAETDTELRSLREDETIPHTLLNGAYQGTASAIADRVARERPQLAWLSLPRGASDTAPLSARDLTNWIAILRRHTDEAIAESKLRLIDSAVLPNPETFATSVSAEQSARNAVEWLTELREHHAYQAILTLPLEARRLMEEHLRDLERQRAVLERRSSGWLKRALEESLEGRQGVWGALAERSHELLTKIGEILGRIGSKVVALPQDRDPRTVRADAAIVADHLEAGGKWKHLGILTPKTVKDRDYLRREATVDGEDATSARHLRTVCDHVDLTLAFSDLGNAWLSFAELPSGPDARLRLVALKEEIAILDQAMAYARDCLEVARTFANSTPAIPEPNWRSGDAQEWIRLIEASRLEEDHRHASAQVSACLGDLRALRDLHDAHPVIVGLLEAIETRNVKAYSEAHARLRETEQTRRDQEQRRQVEQVLTQSVPGLVDAITTTRESPDWDDRLVAWENAWRWAIADQWLTKRIDFAYQQKLWQRRGDTETEISRLLAEAAALRAWSHFFRRLSVKESAALRGWREAVKAMGKGTGRSNKLANLRREARTYMDQCRDAIPIWIMPRYLVAEMIDPSPARYDVVIIDEASQLGVESLFLFYVGKKMVVVGDDQQISPYGVGIADADIAGLQRHYLEGIPHKVGLSAQSSLYANAKIRFGQNIVLREHFRCMPEIIQFSNDLCYASNGTPLDPLRAYPANRLKPLVVRHVPDGYRIGGTQNAQNIAEADAIAAQIVACVADPRYAALSMGVISLLGEAQAKLIERKLLDALEPEVIEERRLICGDAYAFQGDERDVMFLSMVAAPGETRISALSSDPARQRFNVAASRARDQMWLFHSVTLDLLSDSCMRHRLLSYMQNPARQKTYEEEQRFESEFERDVFRLITQKGFHVRTQVWVGDPTNHRYRIDLVVEGMQGRLAVECDGDKWHGPDRYEQDMARQRDLERAQWRFARIRGGDFYRDPTRAMELIWAELDHLGIRPGGIDVAASEPPPPCIEAPQHMARIAVESSSPADEKRIRHEEESDSEDKHELVRVANEPIVRRDQEAPNQPRSPISRGTTAGLGPVSAASSPLPSALHQATGSRAHGYTTFEGNAGPDPRTASTAAIAQGLYRIIETEGPMCAKRAYDIYLRGCGIQRLGGEIKKTMNRALNKAVSEGKVLKEDEKGTGGLLWTVVRVNGAPAVTVRERGPRSFDEIPPSELQIVGRRLAAQLGLESGSDAHLRAILEHFDLVRLTTQVGTSLLSTLERRFPYVDDFLAKEH